VRLVGRARARRLRRLGAPTALLAYECSPVAIARSLGQSPDDGFLLDNGVDRWLFSVQPISTAGPDDAV
jgi:hypothetical protein